MGKINTLKLKCPCCESWVSIDSHAEKGSGKEWNIDTAPLTVLAEICKESKYGRLLCFSCGCDLALEVRFIADVMPLSQKERYHKRWRKEG